MASLFWFLLFAVGAVWLAYRRTDLRIFTVAFAIALFSYTAFGDGHWLWLLFLWLPR